MHLVSIDEIKRNSEELNELNRRLHSTAGTRSSEHDKNCRLFHEKFDELVYPGGGAMLLKVREGNTIALENAVRFISVDPLHFRSGYLKEYLWRWLQHAPLSRSKVARLESAALSYLDRRVSREFWCMAKAMNRLGTPNFWLKVASVVEQPESPRRLRAIYLIAHGINLHSGAMLRRRLYRRWLSERYGGS